MLKYINEIRSYYIDKFYSKVDMAHGKQHIEDVERKMLNTISDNGTNKVSDEISVIITLTAYLHDIHATSNREYHHVEAANYVINNSDIYLNKLSSETRNLIADAILSHRSSSNIDADTWLSNLLFIADTDLSLSTIILRAVNHKIIHVSKNVYRVIDDPYSDMYYSYGHAFSYVLNDDNMVKNILSHIRYKYGRDGYLYQTSKMQRYVLKYNRDIKLLWDDIDKLSWNDIPDIANNIFPSQYTYIE